MTTIYEQISRGEPLDSSPFIDTHGHFGPWSGTCIPHALDGARVIAEMDRFGCDMVWTAASDPGFGDAMAIKNDYVFALAEQYPERIVPYCTLSANEPDACLAELTRCLARGRCVGVKMHVYTQASYTLRSAFLQPVFELLHEHQLVYLNHTLALGVPEDLPWALARYPDVTFIAGHAWPEANDLAKTFPNLYDCTCAAQSPDWVAQEVRRCGGSTMMLVGSDFPLFCLAFGVGMLAYATLPESDKRNILGVNALRILERISWFEPSMLQCTQWEAISV